MAQGDVTATTPSDADDRLAKALAFALLLAAKRLAPKLERANTATYLRQMRANAKAFAQPLPKAITDKNALAAIAARARVSAESIVSTQADRMRALVAESGSLASAKAPFKAWEKQQASALAAFEASKATHAALKDFTTRNGLSGTEHLEPTDAAVDDICRDDIDRGDVPIGTLGAYPAHLNCPHYVVRSFDQPTDPSGLWFGGGTPLG